MVYPITAHCHGAPARRGRRLRDRGDDDPGSDLVRDDALRRARAALGAAPGRGRAAVPALGRPARDGERRQQPARRRRRGRRGAASRSTSSRPSGSAIDAALEFSREVLEAAGATQVCWTGLVSTHVQGSCRMGDDPARSAVDRNGESHEVKRLFVGDASLVPRTLSVNPSLTIMALATRLADHLDADASGYLGGEGGRREVGSVRAALLGEYHRPLELVERPEPEPSRRHGASSSGSAARASARPTCTRSTGSWSRPASGCRSCSGTRTPGWVHAVGDDVTTAAVGDPVLLYPAWSCGLCVPCRRGSGRVLRASPVHGADARRRASRTTSSPTSARWSRCRRASSRPRSRRTRTRASRPTTR